VRSTAADPGWASTGFTITSGHRAVDLLSRIATPLMAHGPKRGSLPTLLATAGDVPGDSLAGPSRWGLRGPATLVERSATASDAEIARRLWTISEELIDTTFPLSTSPIS
jgi:hypothetical protein